MRKFIIIVGLVLAIVAAAAIYLFATTPSQNARLRFPLSASQRALLAQVPASAESFALIPAAAGLEPKLRANPVTAQTIDEFEAKQKLPDPWMIGGADLLAWRGGEGNRYLVRLDPFRAFLLRTWMMAGGDIGDRLLINAPPDAPIEPAELQRILALTDRLPPGDALVVQRQGSRGAFPPIPRPAVTSIAVSVEDIQLVSRATSDHPARGAAGFSPPNDAATDTGGLKPTDIGGLKPTDPGGLKPAAPRGLAKSALLSGAFGSPPRDINDLNRLFGTKVSTLLENGGGVAIYDVDVHKLLPRPIGVIAVPDDPQRRAALEAITNQARQAEAFGVHARTAAARGELVLSFDNSIDLYLKDTLEPPRGPANRWAMRCDPQRLVPILRSLADNLGMRVAAPHLYRSARDLGRWIGALENAKSIEAADSVDGAEEQLYVRVGAK